MAISSMHFANNVPFLKQNALIVIKNLQNDRIKIEKLEGVAE